MEGLWYLCGLPLLFVLFLFGAFTKGQRSYIFWRAGAKCESCSADWNDGYMLECDHIKPLHAGGSDHVDNGQLLCRPCHANKHESAAHDAKKRGDSTTHNKEAYSARQIRRRSVWRRGFAAREQPSRKRKRGRQMKMF